MSAAQKSERKLEGGGETNREKNRTLATDAAVCDHQLPELRALRQDLRQGLPLPASPAGGVPADPELLQGSAGDPRPRQLGGEAPRGAAGRDDIECSGWRRGGARAAQTVRRRRAAGVAHRAQRGDETSSPTHDAVGLKRSAKARQQAPP